MNIENDSTKQNEPAFPLPVKSEQGMTANDWMKVSDEPGEDSLWLDVIKRIAFEYMSIRKDNLKVQIHTDAAIIEFKKLYSLTKR